MSDCQSVTASSRPRSPSPAPRSRSASPAAGRAAPHPCGTGLRFPQPQLPLSPFARLSPRPSQEAQQLGHLGRRLASGHLDVATVLTHFGAPAPLAPDAARSVVAVARACMNIRPLDDPRGINGGRLECDLDGSTARALRLLDVALPQAATAAVAPLRGGRATLTAVARATAARRRGVRRAARACLPGLPPEERVLLARTLRAGRWDHVLDSATSAPRLSLAAIGGMIGMGCVFAVWASGPGVGTGLLIAMSALPVAFGVAVALVAAGAAVGVTLALAIGFPLACCGIGLVEPEG